jgi:hypothetical protein
MSARRRLIRRSAALLATLLLTLPALGGVANASPAGNGPGPRSNVSATPSEPTAPAPTVVRTIVKEDAARVLPIALAGAALLIAIAGTGYAVIRTAPMRQQLRGEA